MGSIDLGTGESLGFPDAASTGSIAGMFATLASNVANLFKRRQRFDFVWANAAARTTQTGAVEGSRGFQKDTLSDWIYTESQWKPARSTMTRTRTQSLNINNSSGILAYDTADITPAIPEFSYSNGSFTCRYPGVFLVTGQFSLQPAGQAVGYEGAVRKNGVVVQAAANVTSTVGTTSVTFSAIVDLEALDTVDVRWFANIGGTGIGVDVTIGKNYIALTRIG